MAPLSPDTAARLLGSHRRLSKDWSEFEGLLVELAPAWAELRRLLIELNRIIGDS